MLRRSLDALYLSSGYLAGFFLVLIFLLMMSLSVGRQIGVNVPSGDDFASWCMAATAFLGLAYTFRSGDMIRVGLLIEKVGAGKKRAMEIACLLVGVAFVGYFAWYAVTMTIDSWRFEDISQGVVPIPLWLPQIGYSGGLVILLVALVDELVHVLAGGEPRYEKPPPASDEEVIERAMQSGV